MPKRITLTDKVNIIMNNIDGDSSCSPLHIEQMFGSITSYMILYLHFRRVIPENLDRFPPDEEIESEKDARDYLTELWGENNIEFPNYVHLLGSTTVGWDVDNPVVFIGFGRRPYETRSNVETQFNSYFRREIDAYDLFGKWMDIATHPMYVDVEIKVGKPITNHFESSKK